MRLGALPRWSCPGSDRLLFVGLLLSGLAEGYTFSPGIHHAGSLGRQPRYPAMDVQGKASRSIHWPAATARRDRAARSGHSGGIVMSGEAGPSASRAEQVKEAWRLAGEARLAFEAAKASADRAVVLRQARTTKEHPLPFCNCGLTTVSFRSRRCRIQRHSESREFPFSPQP